MKTFSRWVATATVVGVGLAAAFAGTVLHPRSPAGSSGTAAPGLAELPETLRETGLFRAGEGSTEIADGIVAFTPQYPLWSDGATKRRWLSLPAGTSIDGSNVDAWQFPVGTRLWKEFSFHGARVETRYMVRARDGWKYGTYVWSHDGMGATLAPIKGAMSVEVAPGVHHKIPSEADCRACHAGATPVLGFSALQLSSDRDPLAPHREELMAGGVTTASLARDGSLRGLSPVHMYIPPRIAASTPIERAALGYLHGNCGGCHRSDGPLASVGMVLAHSIASPGTVQRTTFAVASQFKSTLFRIAPGAHADSLVFQRMSARTPVEQMPPLGTQLVDTEATHLIATWIDQLAETNHRTEEIGK